MISVGWVGSVGGEAWWDRRQIGSLGETTRDQDLFRFVLDFLPLGDQDLFGFIFRFLSTEGEKACLGHRQRQETTRDLDLILGRDNDRRKQWGILFKKFDGGLEGHIIPRFD